MSTHAAARLAWSMWVLSLGLTALSLLLLTLNLSHVDVPIYFGWVEETLIAISCSTVGAVVVSRRPENTIGWLFCTIGFLFAVGHFCGEYGIYTLLASPGSLPAGEAVVWVRFWIWGPSLDLSVFLFLLFPDGRLPGSGWRLFVWLNVLLLLMGTVLMAFSPGSLLTVPIQNPLGIEGLPNFELVNKSVQVVTFAFLFVAAAAIFMRLRRARGVERQQIKWVAYAAMATASGAILTYSVSEAIGVRWVEWIGYILMLSGVLGGPISMGIAILRYRLYEIDIIIDRTLVYGPLTAVLAGVFELLSVVLQHLLLFLTGEESEVANVVSALIIAVLFDPLRRRIEAFIDRVVYRHKDNAEATTSESHR